MQEFLELSGIVQEFRSLPRRVCARGIVPRTPLISSEHGLRNVSGILSHNRNLPGNIVRFWSGKNPSLGNPWVNLSKSTLWVTAQHCGTDHAEPAGGLGQRWRILFVPPAFEGTFQAAIHFRLMFQLPGLDPRGRPSWWRANRVSLNETSTGNELPPGSYLRKLAGQTYFATKRDPATDRCVG